MKRTLTIILFCLITISLSAQTSTRKTIKATRAETQKFLVSTNLYDWADYGTINFNFGYVLGRHFSLDMGLKYNDWQFKSDSQLLDYTMHKQKTASVGFRYWPWYVFSGWWISAKGQYSDININGVNHIRSSKSIGAGLSTGYTLMITKRFNIEFGAGFWYKKNLVKNLEIVSNGQNFSSDQDADIKDPLFAPNDLSISLQFLF